jgi:hypothetical protein
MHVMHPLEHKEHLDVLYDVRNPPDKIVIVD